MSQEPVVFEGLGRCFYRKVEFRPPRKGEFYLSGAIVQAWRAPNDLTMSFHVVVPTCYARQSIEWLPGDPVQVTDAGVQPALPNLKELDQCV